MPDNETNFVQIKQDRLLYKSGLFSPNEGRDGDMGVCRYGNKIYMTSKVSGKWYYTDAMPNPSTANLRKTTSSVNNSELSNDSVTITAGNGLVGGGEVELGDSITLTSQADENTITVDSVNDYIKIKDGGVTETQLNSSVAGTGISGGGGVALSTDYGTGTSTISPDDSVGHGSTDSAARTDHTHAIVAAVANSITPDASAAEGSSTSFSRADHTHEIRASAPGSLSVNLSASTEGSSSSFARADHTHDLDESITPLWTGLHTHNEDIYLYTGKKIYWGDSNQYISGDATSITIDGDDNLTLISDVLNKSDSPKFHFRTPYSFRDGSVTDAYYIRAQTDGQMMTFGEGDLQANFSLISAHELMDGVDFDSSFDDTSGSGWA